MVIDLLTKPKKVEIQTIPNISTTNDGISNDRPNNILNVLSKNNLSNGKQNNVNNSEHIKIYGQINGMNTNTKTSSYLSFKNTFCSSFKKIHPIYYCFIDPTLYSNRYPLISRFIFLFSSELLFNALYYSDKIISHTYHNGYSFL